MANRLKINPNLFGMPFQFPANVDPRIEGVSSNIGRKFAENIGTEAPICTFIPGVADYLANDTKGTKVNSSIALLQGSGQFGNFLNKKGGVDSKRLYDFKNAYGEYIKYVNVLCRTGALFLELGDVKINKTKLRDYNWKDFRWNDKSGNAYTISGSLDQSVSNFNMTTSVSDGVDLNEVLTNKYFVQFYVDADVSASDSFSNSTGESMIKSALDSGSSTMKELAFMANSGAGEGLDNFVDSSATALSSGVSSILGNGTVTGALSRIINLGSETLKGNNIIIPDIYQNSSYSKSYSITIHLKTPYGNALGYYLNIFVPLMHLICLAIPRQATANSYESPFMVKAYVDGVMSCNMGMIQGLSVSRLADSWTTDGLPAEVDVTIDLVDLYSGIQMSSSTTPALFINNASLIEYLAVSCGLSLTSPNIDKKVSAIAQSLASSVLDIPSNIKTTVDEGLYTWINNKLKLYN